jgi:hypothetical protein
VNWRWYLALIVVSLSLGRWYFHSAVRQHAPETITVTSGGHTAREDRYREFPDGRGVTPHGYPADVPLHPGGRIVSTIELPRPEWMHWNVVFEAELPAGELETWYRQRLAEQGWTAGGVTRVPPSESAGEATVLTATKARRRLEVIWGSGERLTVTQTLVEPN